MSENVRHPLRVTIVDEGGSIQFTMTKAMQKIALYICVAIVAVLIIGYISMSSLITQLDDIKTRRQEVDADYQRIYEKNAILQDDIDKKTQELNAMQNKVSDLEKVLSMHNNNHAGFINGILKDSDIQNLDQTQKNTILQIVPNGNPLNSFSAKQKIRNGSRDIALVNLTYQQNGKIRNAGYEYYTDEVEPVYATADGIAESVRDNNIKYGYGNLVRLSHVFGLSSAYTNLSKVSVKEGDFVSKGDIIGYTTKSQNNRQRSLYYEIRFMGDELDTLAFIEWNILNFKSIFDSNENLNVKSLVWALGDIIKLNDLSSHFGDAKSSDMRIISQAQSSSEALN